MAFVAPGRQQDRKRGGLVPQLLRIGVVVALVALVLLSVIAPQRLDKPRLVAQQTAAPLVWVYKTPVNTVREVIAFFASYLYVHEENARLKKKIVDSDLAQRRLDYLEHENAALRAQLKASQWPAKVVATGQVLSHGGGTYLKSLLVAAGSRDGVQNGQAAVSKAGLVGQVVAVSDRLSRVLMVNDFSSRIPVLINETATPGIAEGTNKADLTLSFLPIDFQPREGAYVSTSGAGGLFPAGLPIGRLTVRQAGTAQESYHVQPFADLEAAGLLTFLSAPDSDLPTAAPLPDQLTSQLSAAALGGE
ncbi:MAG: rod shape-determining protein MreC [Pseudomonadota bacterium]